MQLSLACTLKIIIMKMIYRIIYSTNDIKKLHEGYTNGQKIFNILKCAISKTQANNRSWTGELYRIGDITIFYKMLHDSLFCINLFNQHPQ